MTTTHNFPPNIVQHWTSSERPIAYYYFLGFGIVCVLVTWYLLIPRIMELYKQAIHERDKREAVLIPFTYNAYLLILLFPACATFLKFFTFISPLTVSSVEFVMSCYESAVLYAFTTLLIMYLGSVNIMLAFEAATPTQFYAVPPLGCCFRSCIKPSILSKQAFRNLYYFIIQYCVLLPIFQFVLLVQGYSGGDGMYQGTSILKTMSVLLCVYGLFALLKASHEILHHHNIHAKFWCIKGLILFTLAPPMIVDLIGHLPEENEMYPHHVLAEAYGAMISLVCLTGLSVAFRMYFKPIDALSALRNSEQKDYTAALELMNEMTDVEMANAKTNTE